MLNKLFPSMVDTQNPTFRVFEKNTQHGVSNLSPALTINSITVNPTLLYYGGDAGSISWAPRLGYGTTLTLQAGTAPSYNQGSPLLGSNDDSVKFNAGGYYLCGDTTTGNITTEDIVIEVVFKTPAVLSGAKGIIGKWTTAFENAGWLLFQSSALLACQLLTGGVSVTVSCAAGTANTWYHAIYFGDRSGLGVFYLNGAAGAAVSLASVTGSLTINSALRAGTYVSGSPYNSNVAYFAMWKQSNWMSTHLNATVALERFNKLIGIYPQVAKGTATPVVQTRATVAYLDKTESNIRKLYQVGEGWLRYVSRNDSNGNNIKGYLPEKQVINKCLSSADLSNATYWVQTNINSWGGSTTLPDKSTSVINGMVCGLVEQQYYVTQSITLTAVQHSVSVFAKSGRSNWLYIWEDISGSGCYFNLSTVTVGTSETSTGYIEDWGNGWCRCCMVYTAPNGNNDLRLYAAEANGDLTIIGNESDPEVYIWGAQVEIGKYMTSYISTTTAAVTRNADVLRYKGDDGNLGGTGSELKGTLKAEILVPSYDAGNLGLFSLNDGGAAADNIEAYIASAGDAFDGYSVATGGAGGLTSGTTVMSNNNKHTVRLAWQNNNLQLYIDEAPEGTPDTSCDMPDNLDRIEIGTDVSLSVFFNGVVSNVEIFKRPTRK